MSLNELHTTRRRAVANRRRRALRERRRGVLLLVVLSLLTLFLLVGTAFLVVSSQYRSGAKVVAQKSRSSLQPGDLTDRAVRQLLRDTGNPYSVIRYHSLLRDMYGTDGFVGRVYAALPAETLVSAQYAGAVASGTPLGRTAGQIVDLFVEDLTAPTAGVADPSHVVALEADPVSGLPVEVTLPQTEGYFNGALLTMLDGAGRGTSARVLDYRYVGADADVAAQIGGANRKRLFRLRVVAFPRQDGGRLVLNVPAAAAAPNDLMGRTFMVNGRALNGAGVGLNVLATVGAERLNAMEAITTPAGLAGAETALLPNAVTFNPALSVRFDPVAAAAGSGDPTNPFDGQHAAAAFTPLNPDLADDGLANGSVAAMNLYNGFTGPGDADESYDAADFQNMFLALQSVTPRARARAIHPTSGASVEIDAYFGAGRPTACSGLDLEDVPIPSFHRPALVNYWFNRLMNAPWLALTVTNASERAQAILQPYDLATGTPRFGMNPTHAALITAIKRRCILRPLREDHPEFDGSNPLSRYAGTYDPTTSDQSVNTAGVLTAPAFEITGPWDVDNDGDGVPDSIWVDLGDPVVSTEDGRLYKPLYAFLVQDMDGRLNLNAHGSSAQLAGVDLDPSTTGANLAGASSSNLMPAGSGWGPADVTLRPVMSPTLPSAFPAAVGNWNADDFARLLGGRPSALAGTTASSTSVATIWGRYGGAYYNISSVLTSPGVPFSLADLGTVENRTLSEKFDWPAYDPRLAAKVLAAGLASPQQDANFRVLHALGNGFGAAPDPLARYAVGLDYRGQPVVESSWDTYDSNPLLPGVQPISLLHDSPYELFLMDPSRRGPVSDPALMVLAYATAGAPKIDDDAPFAPGELERLLRPYDADAGELPDRLWNLVDAFDPLKLVVAQNNAPGAATQAYAATPAQLAQAQITAAINRRSVTSDSFDVPASSEDWSRRLINGADGRPGRPLDPTKNSAPENGDDDQNGQIDDGSETFAVYVASQSGQYDTLFNQGCDDYVVVMRENPPVRARLIDYLRYRVVLGLKRDGVYGPAVPATNAALALSVNLVINGDNTATSNQVRTNVASFGGLMAPETLGGMKLDLNRPFGDGRDNNGNGVVDEPQEAGEPWVDSNGNGVWDNEPYIDLDGDGRFYADRNGDGALTAADWLVNSAGVAEPIVDSLWASQPGGPFAFDYTQGQDATGRGAVTPAGQKIHDDARMARQLYARHLYCLMLLLMDENYLAPWDPDDPQVMDYIDPDSAPNKQQIFDVRDNTKRIPAHGHNGSPAWHIARAIAGTGNNPTPQQKAEARRLALRKLTCRQVAQWAINCADMRDPDVINSEFEYDENPWDGWNVVDRAGGQIYPLDGDLATDENARYVVEVTGAGFAAPVQRPNSDEVSWLDRTRGVVWGTERPELLITETLGLHDRRLEDIGGFEETNLANSLELDQEEKTNHKIGDVDEEGKPLEDDLDQRLRPLGAGIVELYNPHSPDGQLPAELYQRRDEFDLDNDGNFDEAMPDMFDLDGDGNRREPAPMQGVVLNRLSGAGPNVKPSPVWRLIAVEEHPWLRNGDLMDGSPAVAGEGTEGGAPAENFPYVYEDLAAGTDLSAQAYSLRSRTAGWSDGQAHPQSLRLYDPDFPTFPGDQMPRVNGRANDQKFPPYGTQSTDQFNQLPIEDRIKMYMPRQYIERAMYFTSNTSLGTSGTTANNFGRNPQNLNVRIPLRSIDIPLALIPSDWQSYLRADRNARAFPDSVYIPTQVESQGDPNLRYLQVFQHRFVPLARDVFNSGDLNSLPGDAFNSDIPIAPVLPGRFAVVGTMGYVHSDEARGGNVPSKDYPGRCITPIGRVSRSVAPSDGTPRDENYRPDRVRRLELMPTPNPDAHGVTFALNAGNESAVMDGNQDGKFEGNVTDMGAIARTTATPNPLLRASAPLMQRQVQPAVAVPVKGMSFSEPLDGYLLRQIELSRSDVGNIPQRIWRPSFAKGEGEFSGGGEGKDESWPFDEPFDIVRALVENHTTPNWRSVHLQRLANPLAPWNPAPGDAQYVPGLAVNPYLTLDSAPVDLTSYNGTDPAEEELGPDPAAPTLRRSLANSGLQAPEDLHRYRSEMPDTAPKMPPGRPFSSANSSGGAFIMTLSSLERGFHGTIPGAGGPVIQDRLLWKQETGSTLPDLKAIRLTGRNRMHGATGNKSSFVHSHQPRPAGDATEAYLPWPPGVTFPDTGQAVSDLHGDGRMDIDDLIPEQHVVDFPIRHSLGYMNNAYGGPYTQQTFEDPRIPNPDDPGDRVSDGAGVDLNSNGGIDPNFYTAGPADINADGAFGDLLGSPHTGSFHNSTYTWLAWNNRPFSGPGELLQVPAEGGTRMLARYSGGLVGGSDQPNPYKGDFFNLTRPNVTNIGRLNNGRYPFGQLMNYFQSATEPSIYAIVPEDSILDPGADPDGDLIPSAGGAPNFHRIMNYVRVPSPFVGAQTRFNPSVFTPLATDGLNEPTADLLAPFNLVDSWREPGRVNLNTVIGRYTPGTASTPPSHWSVTYDGVMHREQDARVNAGQLSQLGPAWRDVLLSRRGYGDSGTGDRFPIGNQYGLPDVHGRALNANFPTFFANPFRGSDEGDLSPLPQMVRIGAESGLLRSHPYSPGADAAWGRRHYRWFELNDNASDTLADDKADGDGLYGRDTMNDVLGDDLAGGTLNNLDNGLVDDPSEAGLVQAGTGDPYNPSADDEWLFQPNGTAVAVTLSPTGNQGPHQRVPLFSDATKGGPVVQTRNGPTRYSFPRMIDGDRNAPLYYNPITRLSSIASTRSGVFAVWVTVGYFEVKPAPDWNDPDAAIQTAVRARFLGDRTLYDKVYPEGYQLAQELGHQTGDIQRHRAFYLVDRTLPVAFKPGEDVNVEKMILVKRRIE
ncbi:hypothetical protein Pla175_35760 [Pirellulimonas nuda]|uniref:Uncharacterized protein n=1 Tax=Pirellulimonas nuda TaxID=2528009 RepID=A0A518DFB4_9BACT|nr:hypothetical protein [Pirellulimonas nuda]QDU90174.1 hypothetical protein Pla175_35760 [Pirellulimonas nuda]